MISSGTSASRERFQCAGAQSGLAAGPITCHGRLLHAFVGDVVDAYEQATGSASVFRFLQLRARLSRAETESLASQAARPTEVHDASGLPDDGRPPGWVGTERSRRPPGRVGVERVDEPGTGLGPSLFVGPVFGARS